MKNLWIILLLLGATLQIQAQDRLHRQERIKGFKVAFFAEQLELSAEESRDFWSIYDEMEEDKKRIRGAYNRPEGKIETWSQAEADQFIKSQFDYEEQLVVLRRKYYERFKTVLPVNKIARIKKTERLFKQRILEMIRERRSRG